MTQAAKHIIFIGQVQGVGFRYTAHRIASRYELTGFIRNMPDGTVEMLVQGPGQDIGDFLRDIRNIFIGYTREITIDEVPPDPKYKDFRITF
jgi:acylphosphatase